MRNPTLSLLLWIAAAANSFSANPPSSAVNPEDFISRYEQALSTQDWSAVEPLIHPTATVTFSDGSLHRGRPAVEEAFRRNFSLIESEQYKMSEVHWIVQTDTSAVFTFVYHWSGLMDGQRISGNGRGTSSLIKYGESWLLTSEHLGPKASE